MPAGNRDTSQRCGKKQSRSPSTSLGSPKTCQKATAPLALRAACANWWRGSWTTGWFSIWRQITSLWMNRLDLDSTEDQVTYISQLIEDGFQKKQHTVAVWLDLEKAFEKVWTEGSSWNYLEIMSRTTCYAGSPSSWKIEKHVSACKGKGVAHVA